MSTVKLKLKNNLREVDLAGHGGLIAVLDQTEKDSGDVYIEYSIDHPHQAVAIIKEILKCFYGADPRLVANAIKDFADETGQLVDKKDFGKVAEEIKDSPIGTFARFKAKKQK